jgi:hypothetical protein
MHDVLEFYAKKAWEQNQDGVMVPSIALLQDRGELARSLINAAPKDVQPENIVQSAYKISAAAIASALSDILHGMVMQPGEHRVMTIAQACVRLQDAEHRIRSVTRA